MSFQLRASTWPWEQDTHGAQADLARRQARRRRRSAALRRRLGRLVNRSVEAGRA
jgi:hypothetical protein